MANRTVQARLKDLKAQGLSYAKLARELGVSRSLVSRWASGERTPSKRARRSIYGRWRRIDKRLRNPGARVDLSGYFRRIWFENNAISTPLNYRNVPLYDFPPSAAVVITIRFTATVSDVGGIEQLETTINETVAPEGDISSIVQTRFEEYVSKAATSFRQLLKVRREAVILRWLK
tara:strand:+ start:164 stop:691 length:528 start_codon:yes stop_codon:yes gene_type:complete